MHDWLVKYSRKIARASRWQLIDVDEQAPVHVTWIEGEHALINIFLNANTAIARSQSTTRGTGKQTSFRTLGLSVVGNILNDDTPLTIDVLGADGTRIFNVTRADIPFTANPVALFESVAIVQIIIKMIFAQ